MVRWSSWAGRQERPQAERGALAQHRDVESPGVATNDPGHEQRRPAITDLTTYDAAMHYMQAGWRLIPLHRVGPDGKTCSCKRGAGCPSAGKHPKSADWSAATPMSGADVHATWSVERPPNLGVVTGYPSGFWVLDIDGPTGRESMSRLIADNADKGAVPKTLLHQTGSGGYHFFFTLPAGFQPKTAAGILTDAGYPGIDVRGVGGQVVLPPSRSNKGDYIVKRQAEILAAPQWLLDLIPQATEKRELPELDFAGETSVAYDAMPPAIQDAVQRYVKTALDDKLGKLDALPRPWKPNESGWDPAVFSAACRLLELAQAPWNDLTPRQAYEALIEHSPKDDAWGAREITEKWNSARQRIGAGYEPLPSRIQERLDDVGDSTDPFSSNFDPATLAKPTKPAAPTPAPPTGVIRRAWDDFGNARRLNDRYPGRIRWVDESGRWMHYTDGAWRTDATNRVPDSARRTLETLADTESHLYSEEIADGAKLSERDQFRGFAGKQGMNARLEAMLKVARTLPAHAARMSDFDADPMILNCRNAAVDLRTGVLIPHSPDLMLMHQASVDFDPDAKAPQWQAFLDRVLPNPEMQQFLARAVGYTLNGLTGEQVMFIHHGSGANGKSVFLRVMEEILGDYAQTVPRTTLLATNNESIPTDVARMVGKRFLQTSETAAGRRLDEEVVKGLTGGEKQTARFLNRDFFDFTPTGTIHYVTNHLPRVTNAESIWRRLVLIGWNVVIPPEERDPHLADRIIDQEAAGVLAWAIRGALDYQVKRLAVPEECRLALEEYREDVDMLGDFIKECLVTGLDESIATPISQIYEAYQGWAFRSGIRGPMDKNTLSTALRERKFKRPADKKGRAFVNGKQQACFLGVGLAVATASYALGGKS